jgi:hypothetical protein
MPLCFPKTCIAAVVAIGAFSGHCSYAMWAPGSTGPAGAHVSDSDPEYIRSSRTNGISATDQSSGSIGSDHAEGVGCGGVARAAALYGVPVAFFTRLIRQESNFNTKAISRAGAQGIAQFMPATARWRGLSNPFEPTQALLESARWLRELQDEFGNLGLAAAAYNAGPRRVKDWMGGRGKLPNETRAYVRIITGRTADEWLGRSETQPLATASGCAETAKLPVRTVAHRALEHGAVAKAAAGIWAIQLLGDSSQNRVLSEYAGLQKRYRSVLGDRAPMIIQRPIGGRVPSAWYFVRVAESSHERANQLCSRLKSAGGSCMVSRN